MVALRVSVLRRLEAEIQEAQLRAKQEMLQGIQVAKEVAEQELTSQRAAFEGRIEALQAELVRAAAFSPGVLSWTALAERREAAPCWALPGGVPVYLLI